MTPLEPGELAKLYDKIEKETAHRRIPKTFESAARKKMSDFFYVKLIEKKIAEVPKKFDMVSPDGNIIGEAKYYRKTKGGESGKYSIFAEYVWLLEKTPAKTKFIVFGGAREIIEKWIAKHNHLFEGNLSFYFYDMETDVLEELNK
jgi:hypothetical protein